VHGHRISYSSFKPDITDVFEAVDIADFHLNFAKSVNDSNVDMFD